ncbi:MAG: hypothetical protein ACKPH7_32805 [Planktothrix sp.]|uniref:hypothetical protein n=1 Tax=Planktothrix sp. TaxID=3088171 RepID=UPI0038D39771
MNNITWNLKDLKDRCPTSLLEEADQNIKSIGKLIANNNSLTEKLLLVNSQVTMNDIIDSSFSKKQLEAEKGLKILVQDLHSLPDYMAQVINVIIVKPFAPDLIQPLNNKDIDINKIIKKLKDIKQELPIENPKYRGIESIIDYAEALINCAEYKYIIDLNNTTKHRKWIDSDYTLKLTPSSEEKSFWLSAFEKDGREYPRVSYEVILTEYKVNILNRFYSLGQEINDYFLL